MAREFIPNINTANEEIVRLDAMVAEFETTKLNLKKAQDDLVAAQSLLDAAPKAEALKAAEDAKTKAEEALTKANTDHATAIAALQGQVDAAKQNGVKAAAAAGVPPVADGKVTGVDVVDDAKRASGGATGLQRAINANTALQAGKGGK